MKQLLHFEFRKLFQAKVLYICAILLFALLVIIAVTNKLMELSFENMTESYYSEIPEDDLFYAGDDNVNIDDAMTDDMSEIMGMNPAQSSGLSGMLNALGTIYVAIIIGVFISVFVCGDFGNAVIKNFYTKGYSRTQVYFAKYLISLFASFLFSALALITGFLSGVFMWELGDGWSTKVLLLIVIQLFTIAAYNSMFIFFAALLKRVGGAMAMSIAVPLGMTLIISLIELLINFEFSIEKYWLGGIMATASNMHAGSADLAAGVVCAIGYIAIFTVCGWLLARKREV